MNDLLIESDNIISFNNNEFFALTPTKLKPAALMPLIERKLNRQVPDSIPDIWATLGLADDSTVRQLQGKIEFSSYGNLRSEKATAEEVQYLKAYNPDLSDNDLIVERFVNLSALDLSKVDESKYTEENPMLRLTVMLKPSEGALAFFLHRSSSGKLEVAEYLQPEPTKGNNVNKRDRLTYKFNLPDTFFPEEEAGGESMESTRVIKVLIFPRNPEYETSQRAIEALESHLIKSPYCLQRYDPQSNLLVKVQDPGEINYAAKTLLLLHGTFSTTLGSFGQLLDDYRSEKSWLYRMVEESGGPYQQIIGFDHRTILDGVDTNEKHLIRMLNGNKFSNVVDVVSSSRGGLLAKQLAQSEKVFQDAFQIHRGALITCSNGVKYYTIGRGISRFLSIMNLLAKRSGRKIAGLITGFAQHSIEFFLNQPGNLIQTPGSKELTTLLNSSIQGDTVYMPVVGDYKPRKTNKKALGKVADMTLDAIITALYQTNRHDWVVETKNQRIADPAFLAPPFRDYDPETSSFNTTHTKFFKVAAVKDLVGNYLEEEREKLDEPTGPDLIA